MSLPTEEIERTLTKISDRTLISLHLVIILIGLAVWISRLGDKVEQHERVSRKLPKLERRLWVLEERLGLKHEDDDAGGL